MNWAATLGLGFGSETIRARFVAFLVVAGASLAVIGFLLARKLLLLRRRASALPDAARSLSLEDLESLERIGGRAATLALFRSLDSPTEFDRAFSSLVRDGAARTPVALVDAERLHDVRLALSHGRTPTYRGIESTRDLDPQQRVLLRSRPAIVAELRENGYLVVELGRRRHPIERGRRFRLVVERPRGEPGGALVAEVDVVDATAGLALIAHAPLEAAEERRPGIGETVA